MRLPAGNHADGVDRHGRRHRLAPPCSSPGTDVATELARSGSVVIAGLDGNPAGGAERAESSYWISSDGGQSWAAKGEICPQGPGGAEVDGLLGAMGADHSIALLCTPRGPEVAAAFGYVSANGGASWSRVTLPAGTQRFGLASDSVDFAVVRDSSTQSRLLRSTNGGSTWTTVATDRTGTGATGFLGFQTPTDGRWVSGNGSTIWTTANGGATWSVHTFQ